MRPTVTLVESGFENGMDAPFSANESDAGKKATITPVSIADSVNAYLHLTDREANKRSATVMQNVKEQLKANGAAGKYYISARIKLDNPMKPRISFRLFRALAGCASDRRRYTLRRNG